MAMFSLINSLFFVWFKDTESALPKESLPKMSAPKKLVFIFASFLCLFVCMFVYAFGGTFWVSYNRSLSNDKTNQHSLNLYRVR